LYHAQDFFFKLGENRELPGAKSKSEQILKRRVFEFPKSATI